MASTRAIALLLGVLTATAAGARNEVFAQDYPNRAIRFIVSTAPGGAVDIFARTIGNSLSISLKQPVVVENKPGANGVIATEFVANAKPDGYTFLVTYEAHTVNSYLLKSVPYDPKKSFAPVSLLATNPMVLVANKSMPAASLAEIIKFAKKNPGKLNSAQFGSSMLIPVKLLNAQAGVNIVPVSYKDRSIATGDLLAGRVDMMFASVISVMSFIKDGSLRPLAVTTATRSSALPDVPTIRESGFPEFEFRAWNGILAPAGTPDSIIQKIQSEIVKALQEPSVRERLSIQATIVGSTPQEFATVIDKELAIWSKMDLK